MRVEQEALPMKADEPSVSVLRVSVVGLGLTLLFALLLPDWVIRFKGDVDTGGFLPLIPVFCTLVLLAVRPVLPGRRWSNPEILAVFCILLIGTSGMGWWVA